MGPLGSLLDAFEGLLGGFGPPRCHPEAIFCSRSTPGAFQKRFFASGSPVIGESGGRSTPGDTRGNGGGRARVGGNGRKASSICDLGSVWSPDEAMVPSYKTWRFGWGAPRPQTPRTPIKSRTPGALGVGTGSPGESPYPGGPGDDFGAPFAPRWGPLDGPWAPLGPI